MWDKQASALGSLLSQGATQGSEHASVNHLTRVLDRFATATVGFPRSSSWWSLVNSNIHPRQQQLCPCSPHTATLPGRLTCTCSACRASSTAWLPPCVAPAAAALLASCQGRYIHSASSSTICCCSARGRNSTRLHWWLQHDRAPDAHVRNWNERQQSWLATVSWVSQCCRLSNLRSEHCVAIIHFHATTQHPCIQSLNPTEW